MAADHRSDDGHRQGVTGNAPTIYALSSGNPPAGIAIIRISGTRAGSVLRDLVGRMPKPRKALHAQLRDGTELIDHALLLWFPGPRSARGEDLAELHLHGGRAVVQRALATMAGISGCRMALPGEFTRRALENGRIDLAEAEGLADLLTAETEMQRRQALRLAEGGLGKKIGGWRERLLMIAASVEALIEFAEEEDVDVDIAAQHDAMQAVGAEIAAALRSPPAERLRDGLRIVLAGPPNVGKSTLLNALVERDVAIATDIAGTTRDLIEVPVIRDGIPLILIDTAGLRPSEDIIERLGIARSTAAIASADITLWLGDEEAPLQAEHVIPIFPRADQRSEEIGSSRLPVSALSGAGVPALWQNILAMAKTLLPAEDQVALNLRHREVLHGIIAALRDRPEDPILIAEQLRTALGGLNRMLGAEGVEDMLDTLFGRFCIGK